MRLEWLPRAVAIAVTGVAFALFRRFAPAPQPSQQYDQQQIPEPLPTGVIGGLMWCIGIALALSFFVFRAANHYWAGLDRNAALYLYPTLVWWCFFPGFAAIAIPWPFTVWLLRRLGRTDEADAICNDSNQSSGINSFVVMKWLSIGLVIPIGILTVLALPIHLSIASADAHLGKFGSLKEEEFPFNQAQEATLVDGYRDANGDFHSQKDLLIDFSDGRRLRANQVGDGGTNADPRAVDLLLSGTGLTPKHVGTPSEIKAN